MDKSLGDVAGDRVVVPVESGLFTAASIPVPPDCVSHDAYGICLPEIKMVEPRASFVEIDPPGSVLSPYALDFWGSDQGGLTCSGKDCVFEVRILLPLDVAAGSYEFFGFFFHVYTGDPLFRASGSFVVPDGPRKDCGCRLMRDMEFDPVAALDPVLRDARLAVCVGCDEFSDGVCMACGCVLAMKSGKRGESCPLGKWGPVDVELGVVPPVSGRGLKKGRRSRG